MSIITKDFGSIYPCSNEIEEDSNCHYLTVNMYGETHHTN